MTLDPQIHSLHIELGLVPEELNVALNAVSPLGITVKLGKVCKKCAITLEDHELPTDLIVLSMREFDVILGINWLTKYHANLDWVSRLIFFTLLRDQAFTF